MTRSPRPALLPAALAALLLAGCTATVAGTPAPTGGTPNAGAASSAPARPSGGDAVSWVDDVCGSLLPLVEATSTEPPIDPSADPETLVAGISDYLGQAGAAADTALEGLAAVGPSPVEGGDEVVAGLTSTLTAFRSNFLDAQSRIDAIDASDPSALITELPAAIAPLEQLADLSGPTAELESTPELQAAAAQAPNCKKVESKTG